MFKSRALPNVRRTAREIQMEPVLDAIDSLALFPYRFRVHQHRKDPAKTVHAMPVPPFMVYYRIIARDGFVEIVAVLHGRQQQPRRFR